MKNQKTIHLIKKYFIHKRILAFAAHPDDLEFYAGGTIAKLAQNNSVHFIIATTGDKGSTQDDLGFDKITKIRKREAQKAAQILGVKGIKFLGIEDGRLISDTLLTNKFVRAILEIKPHILFTFDPWNVYQIHPDHRSVGMSVLDSVIEVSLAKTRAYYGIKKENIVLEKIFFYDTLEPNVFSGIDQEWNKKALANKIHKSQYQEYQDGWKNKKAVITKLGNLFGKYTKGHYAEAFRMISLDPDQRYIDSAVYAIKNISHNLNLF
jgi:LmbE family N-acetylglucosaminyl deacetylase